MPVCVFLDVLHERPEQRENATRTLSPEVSLLAALPVIETMLSLILSAPAQCCSSSLHILDEFLELKPLLQPACSYALYVST